MALIDLIEVSKKFGANEILNEVNFSVNERERIAIVGKNGGGKSTLMKILCGAYEPDSGRVITQNNISVAMLAQTPKFDENLSVKEAMNRELKEIFDAREQYAAVLEELAAQPENKELHAHSDELVKFIEAKEGWDIERKIERVLEKFKLKEYEDRAVCSLSGGEIRRVALGALILKHPDVLLLDEPTNHLDVYMVKFLEEMLKNSRQTIVFISHDRYFIDVLATRTVEIEEAQIRSFEGGYANYLMRKQELLESLAKSHETLLKQLKSEEEWLRRGVKARLKRNEGRKERVLAMREEAKKNPSVIRRVRLELERASKNFNQTQSTNRKKMLFEIKNLSKNIGGKLLFEKFDARVLQGERIAIVGRNGSGKSTLLKILLGFESASGGEIKRGDVRVGYFDQSRSALNDEKSLIETFCPNGGDHVMVRGRNMHVYGYLKNFLFPKEFLDIIDNSIRVAVNKEEIKKTIKNIYEDPYTYVSISKYKENLILFTEENMVNRGKIKNTISVVLKRELTDNEKNELIYLKNNDNDEFFNKYRTYIDIETTKTYINDKLELFQEIKGLTDTIILYRKNEVSKEVLEYTDSSRLNSVAKEYRNDRLLKETFVKNKEIVLEKEYYANGKLAREIPLKDGLINGEAKDYYENGKIRSTATFVNGHIDGVVKEYNQAGKVIKETLYKNGKKVK